MNNISLSNQSEQSRFVPQIFLKSRQETEKIKDPMHYRHQRALAETKQGEEMSYLRKQSKINRIYNTDSLYVFAKTECTRLYNMFITMCSL